MRNEEIVDVLNDIANLLRIKKESIFKIRAYEKVASAITESSLDISRLVRENRLREIPGIGDAIEKKITELITTGRLEYYEKLKSEAAGVEDGKS
ncbi:MAG: hypothetical protein JW712_11045 [Dehalococcoidales bacterium]|nr:hypothetical protein [Dehalococcoidales bacterium]